MSRLIAVMAAANLFSNSVFPMALAAWTICLNTSTRSRNARIKLPSYISVFLLQISLPFCRGGIPNFLEIGALGPRVYHIHQFRFEGGDIFFLDDRHFTLLTDFGDSPCNRSHYFQRIRKRFIFQRLAHLNPLR